MDFVSSTAPAVLNRRSWMLAEFVRLGFAIANPVSTTSCEWTVAMTLNCWMTSAGITPNWVMTVPSNAN